MIIKIIITAVVSLFISAQIYANTLKVIDPNFSLLCPVDQSSTDFITKKDDKTIKWITKKTNKKSFNTTWCLQKPDKSNSYPPGSIVKFNGIGYNNWGWN